MANDKELVYVPQGQSMFANSTFWMGVVSSLVATAIFWYVVHDVWPVDGGPIKEDETL